MAPTDIRSTNAAIRMVETPSKSTGDGAACSLNRRVGGTSLRRGQPDCGVNGPGSWLNAKLIWLRFRPPDRPD